MKVELIPVWRRVTPELAQELMAFWQASKAGETIAVPASPLWRTREPFSIRGSSGRTVTHSPFSL